MIRMILGNKTQLKHFTNKDWQILFHGKQTPIGYNHNLYNKELTKDKATMLGHITNRKQGGTSQRPLAQLVSTQLFHNTQLLAGTKADKPPHNLKPLCLLTRTVTMPLTPKLCRRWVRPQWISLT